MTRPLFGLLLVVAALLQSTLLPRWQLLAVTPSLVVVLLLAWSAYRGIPEALAWVLIAGFALDVLGLDRLGANALALLPVALLGGLSRGRFFHSALVFPMVLAMAATFLYVGTLLALRGLLGEGGDVPGRAERDDGRECIPNAGASDDITSALERVAGAPCVWGYRVVAAHGA